MRPASGHGECNLGFCKCHDGWWGQDCAYRTPGTLWSPGAWGRAGAALHVCEREGGAGVHEARVPAHPLSSHPLYTAAAPLPAFGVHTSLGARCILNVAVSVSTLPVSSHMPLPSAGLQEGERPWIKDLVHTPASKDPEPGATRKRPRIYV